MTQIGARALVAWPLLVAEILIFGHCRVCSAVGAGYSV